MWNYTKDVMDHFLNPRNVGEIPDADAVAEVGNITCGDALKIFLKIDKDGRICDARFKTFGCASAIASSSALTELVKGMTLDEAAKVTNKDIVKLLGTLPEEKMHCLPFVRPDGCGLGQEAEVRERVEDCNRKA